MVVSTVTNTHRDHCPLVGIGRKARLRIALTVVVAEVVLNRPIMLVVVIVWL